MSTKHLITLIHVARNEAGLDEETYRAKLAQVTNGKTSLRKMNQRELTLVLDSFKEAGFKVKHKKPAPRVSTNAAGQPRTPEIGKIRAVWSEMFAQGFVEDGSEAALNAYVQRMTSRKNGGAGVHNVGWLDAQHAERVLESLKQWHLRLIKKALTARCVAFPDNNGEPFRAYEPYAALFDRLHKYDKYIKSLKASDAPLIGYACLRCGFLTLALKPILHDVYDSLCTCPACGVLYHRGVSVNTVTIKIREAQ